ncbi:MAG: hypothetical protein AB7T49_19225 [Oligoflexales bacterium]
MKRYAQLAVLTVLFIGACKNDNDSGSSETMSSSDSSGPDTAGDQPPERLTEKEFIFHNTGMKPAMVQYKVRRKGASQLGQEQTLMVSAKHREAVPGACEEISFTVRVKENGRYIPKISKTQKIIPYSAAKIAESVFSFGY